MLTVAASWSPRPSSACDAEPIAEASSPGPSALTSRSMSSSACWNSSVSWVLSASTSAPASRLSSAGFPCTTRSTNVVPNTVAGRIRATTLAGTYSRSSSDISMSMRTPPDSSRSTELTLPTRTPPILTSEPLRSAPPASATTADTCGLDPKVPLLRSEISAPITASATSTITPRRARV